MYRCSKVFNERAYHHHLDAQVRPRAITQLRPIAGLAFRGRRLEAGDQAVCCAPPS